jgi:hypothetical protein
MEKGREGQWNFLEEKGGKTGSRMEETMARANAHNHETFGRIFQENPMSGQRAIDTHR